MKEEIILKDVGLTHILRWLNQNFKKSDGSYFTISNVQQYAYTTGRLPKYLGEYRVEKNDVRLYNVVKEKGE